MPTFIDESGDPGSITTGSNRSTPHFRMAAVWLPTRESADQCAAAIRSLWGRLGAKAKFKEFHYVDLGRHPDMKDAFFDVVLEFPFRFTLASLTKSPDWDKRLDREETYRRCLVPIAMSLRTEYLRAESTLPQDPLRPPWLNETVLADDNKDPVYLKALCETFLPLGTCNCGFREPRRFLGPKPRFVNSKQSDLVQLADMVCGATCDHLAGYSEWYSKISGRLLDIWHVT